MILSSSLVLLMSLNGRLTRSEGLILILTYIPYAASVLKSARNGIQQNSAHALRKKQGLARQIFLLVIGIAGVITGSKISIDSGANLGTALGIPAIAIGVVLFAFGTSLPEFAIGLSATLKNKSDVTIGEVYASNIFTQMVVLGICCLIRPIQVPPALSLFAMPLLVLATVVIQIFVTTDLRIKRIEALGLLIFYMVFVTSQFVTLPAIEELLGF